jgi:hypothetical protein
MNGRRKINAYETCEMPPETERSDATVPISGYGFTATYPFINLCSTELEAFSEIMISV